MSYTRHTWENGEVITEAKMNNIEDGIEEGGGKYGGYDYVFRAIGSNGITIIKGDWQSIYNKLQNEEIVFGLCETHSMVDPYNNATCQSIPLTYTQYYSSSGLIHCYGGYYSPIQGSNRYIYIEWDAVNGPELTAQ